MVRLYNVKILQIIFNRTGIQWKKRESNIFLPEFYSKTPRNYTVKILEPLSLSNSHTLI